MKDLLRTVVKVLLERGHQFVGEAAPPLAATVREKNSAVLVTLRFKNSQHRVVVKGIPADAMISTTQELFRVHHRIRSASDHLAASLPRFLGLIPDRDLLVIEFVPGPTLQTLLNRAVFLWLRRHAAAALAATARSLGEFHRWRAADVGVPCFLRLNRSFLPDMGHWWNRTRLVDFLSPQHQRLESLYDHLKPAFFDRAGDRLTPYDCQPKNVIVGGEGGVSFVDLDYFGANPVISVAAFLGSLDRIGLRFPAGLSDRLTGAWKRKFLRSYCEHGAEDVVEDLVFFYPWTLVQQHDSLTARHPRLRRYLARYYGGRIDAFVSALDAVPWAEVRRSPERLFQ